MTFFKLISGYDCGVDKTVCQLGYPDYCLTCMTKTFSDANILMDVVEVIEQSSEQKRKELLYKLIWRKYQDVLTIRHIIILSKSGLPAFNMAVADLPIDASLISGFIHANVAFSSEDLTMLDNINPEKEFYEFEYKNFHILLKNGQLCRICLILDKRASVKLRELLSSFTNIFEDMYREELKEFEMTGELSLFDSAKSLIEQSFDVSMKYPLKLSSQIPPSKIESLSLLKKAIYESGRDLLHEETYFFIPTLIELVSKLLGITPKEEILWNIYQMMRENIIFWEKTEFTEDEIDEIEKHKKERENIIHQIMDVKDLNEILFDCIDMDEEEARVKIDTLFNKGEIAEKDRAYQEALNEYRKALTYAKEFSMSIEIGKISYKVVELMKRNNKVELEFAVEQANKAEKKKNLVIALKYLFRAKELLTAENESNRFEKQINKVNIRIQKIQNRFKS